MNRNPAFLFLMLFSCVWAGTISLHSSLTLNSGTLTLGDCISETSLSPSEQQKLQPLLTSVLTVTSQKNANVKYPSSKIRQILDQGGLSAVKLNSGKHILIKRSGGYTLQPSEITKRARAFLAEQYSFDSNSTVELQTRLIAQPLTEKPVEWVFEPGNITGNSQLTLRLNVIGSSGKNLKSLNLLFRVTQVKPVFVARRTLERGEMITSDCLEQRSVDIFSLSSQAVTDESELIGKITRSRVQQGSVFSSVNLDRPLGAKRGELVVIVAENKTLRITATGKMLQNGYIGDTVLVENVGS